MNENFEHDARDYLLHQMDAVRRAAFEQQLADDAEARATLKACADALASFASDIAPPEPLNAADHRATLDGILASTHAPRTATPTAPAGGKAWPQWFWPAAALLLLALNLIEFRRPLQPGGRLESIAHTKESPLANPPPSHGGEPGPDRTAGTDPNTTTAPRPGAPPRNNPNAQAGTPRELERLRAELAESQRMQQKIRLDYDALLERVADHTVVNQQLNRLTTMELVDNGSYARGERRGLVNVGRGVLTEPGVVIAAEPPPTSGDTAASAPHPAYAWSVFDEKENRGYLNLYRLPSVPADQAMAVWVRPAAGAEYQHVGDVPPNFYGHNGYLEYTLPTGSAPPAEILITVEPRSNPPTAPSGPTVLRGP